VPDIPDTNQASVISPNDLLNYSDYKSVRNNIFDRVHQSVTNAFPIQNDRHTLALTDIKYTGPDRYSLKEQKKYINEDRTMGRKLTGRWQLTDNATGNVLSTSRSKTLMNVPYLTDRGTFIRNGVEYTISKQLRLSPGVYTRHTDDGLIESHFNVKPRTGRQFRIFMDPKSSVFYMRYAGRKVALFPILHAMGYETDQLKQMWGDEIFKKNELQRRSPHAISFLQSFAKEVPGQKTADDVADRIRAGLLETFSRMELDEGGTTVTLGEPHASVRPDTLVSATRKILGIARNEQDTDDRDSLEFQTLHDTSDFLSEKIRHDQHGIMRNALWKSSGRGDLEKMYPGILDGHLKQLFNNSGLAQSVEEINPMDMYDQNQRVVRFGEGALASMDAVPKEARNVNPSYANFIDPVRSPESMRVGVDMRFARNTRKGKDGQLYTQFLDAKTLQPTWISAKQAARSVIGFPEALSSTDKFVPALHKAKGMFHTPKEELDYIIPNGDDMFSEGANLVPLKSGVKGMRLLMGSKFAVHALPLVNRQSPLVQTTSEDGKRSTEDKLGGALGAVKADQKGVVTAVYKDRITMSHTDGSVSEVDLYDSFPFSRKTYIRNIPIVKAGDQIRAGQLLATSNFTDKKGQAALGMNLRIGYLNYDGLTFEDAIVISESAAKKLTSEHMYREGLDKEKDLSVNKDKFRALYPSRFNKVQLDKIGDNGVAKNGSVLNYGDPVYVAVREKEAGPGSFTKRIRRDESAVWTHQYPGVVVDSTETRKGISVNIRANAPMQEADKLSNRFGAKGVISRIVKDSEMPRDAKGNAMDVLMSPLGIASRTNSAQMAEVVLGKIADRRGKPYNLPGFSEGDMIEFAESELAKANMSDTEDLADPRTGKTIPGIFTGLSYFYKLQHTSESKGKSRSQAAYTQDEQPARGGKSGSKHIGDMEIQAILAHGAEGVLKDLKIIQGQKNDNFWRQVKLGQTPVMPGTPLVYKKFKALLRGAGVELREEKDADHIFAMTNEKAKSLTGNRRITNTSTYGVNSNKPLEGGLFDPDATDSEGDGTRWSYIQLPEALPNPIMEEPMRSILGMTKKEFDQFLTEGSDDVPGPKALKDRLHRVNLESERMRTIDLIKNGAKSKRDASVKKLGYLDAMIKNKVRPEDFLMDRVPVLPPKYRPIVRTNDLTMVADPNYMYKALLESIEDFEDSKGLPTAMANESRSKLYGTYKSLVGVSDPVQQQLKEKNIGGIIQQVFGKGSSKRSFTIRRTIGTNIDISGLGVVSPNPSLKLNEAGIPEKLAWDLYEPFIIRELVKHGMPATEAATSVSDHSDAAAKALQSVIKERPVILNRAPTLHKYSMLSFWPVITKGSHVQVSPTIVKPLGMDFDGDTAAFSVPVSDNAVKESVEKMMPDRNLLYAKDDKPTFAPSNEYLQGLYFATKEPSNRPERTFATEEDAIKAFHRGEIRVDDPIKILHKEEK